MVFLATCAIETSPGFHDFAPGVPCMLGIDEAGRGPVLGPMLYACAVCPVDQVERLKDLGVDDSKALTESRRDSLLAKLSCNRELVAYAWRALSPRLISTAMLARAKCSLNEISHLTAIHLIQAALDAHINVVEVYVDTVGPPESYQRRLESRFAGIAITVAKKADSLFPIVSAASIVAKVNRDRIVSNWQFTEGAVQVPAGGYGSGYPGDPNTKQFIVDSIDPVFGYSSFVRFSWKTAQIALDKHAARCRWDDEIAPSASSLRRFCSSTSGPSRHAFFADRFLHSVSDL